MWWCRFLPLAVLGCKPLFSASSGVAVEQVKIVTNIGYEPPTPVTVTVTKVVGSKSLFLVGGE
jgi:hypothetical protein